MFFILFFFFFLVVFLLLSVAFLTLFERHLLSMSQLRKGPNKVSFFGIFQAFFDGLKLFKNNIIIIYYSSSIYFFFMPFFMFFNMFFEWFVVPYFFSFKSFDMTYLLFLCLVGSLVYIMMLCGIYSKSKYSVLGSIRSSSQSISFEVVFFFFLYCFMVLTQSFTVMSVFCMVNFFFMPLMLLMIMVELNRPPFDFSEGESELVSGYNLEFGGFLFVMLFLSEYGFMLFFSIFLSYLYFYDFMIFSLFFLESFLFIRSAFPRYRYDKLMYLFWIVLLPLVMFLFLFYYLFFNLFKLFVIINISIYNMEEVLLFFVFDILLSKELLSLV